MKKRMGKRTSSSDSDADRVLLSEDGGAILNDVADASESTSEELSDPNVSLANGRYKVRLVSGRGQRRNSRILKYGLVAIIFACAVGLMGYLIHRHGEVAPDSSSQSRVLKAPRDKAEYKVFKMASGLTVLLISDNSTSNLPAAVSMNVGAGSLADPDDIPGLAHFLEHMLFMGTDKYPDEDSFSHFLSSNGGSYNAYTSSKNTNFFFKVYCELFGNLPYVLFSHEIKFGHTT